MPSDPRTFQDIIRTEADFRAVMGHPSHRSANKSIAHLDAHCRAFIARSPFVLVATSDGQGRFDVSPKGDPPGFVRVLDDHTLAIPDRPGNRRADGMMNLLKHPYVGLLFLIPGKNETLRISGEALLVRDENVLEPMTMKGRKPQFAIVVRVRQAFMHCAKCMIRSDLWSPDAWPDFSELASYGEVLKAHGNFNESVTELNRIIDTDARERLY